MHLPESLTFVSSSGCVYLPPTCNTNDFGDTLLRPWRRRGVGCMRLPAVYGQYSIIWILPYFLLFYFNIAQLAVNLNTFGYAN
ncbi:Uncharacterised protein [Yersinia kristensenii]|nr:hypothetical protein CRM81_20980 [Yersinia kristensenii]CNG15734.1 Uncharacterised protein [Yersinia kristensenii]